MIMSTHINSVVEVATISELSIAEMEFLPKLSIVMSKPEFSRSFITKMKWDS